MLSIEKVLPVRCHFTFFLLPLSFFFFSFSSLFSIFSSVGFHMEELTKFHFFVFIYSGLPAAENASLEKREHSRWKVRVMKVTVSLMHHVRNV